MPSRSCAPGAWETDPVRVLVAMSGGVDSSVAAARLLEDGHEVVGATLKLWGGESDSGCCSLADVADARRVADRLGIDHHVFNYVAEFEAAVVDPYVAAHERLETPNPCAACNRHLKFGLLLRRAERLGFDALATGHHARVEPGDGGRVLRRGVDAAKDQSYVLAMLTQAQLERLVLPIGALTKAEVRAAAARLGLHTAAKPDSQDVCFVAPGTRARRAFLASRARLGPGRLVDDETGEPLGEVAALELVTVGQRRHLGAGGPARRYVVALDPARREARLGGLERLLTREIALRERTWTGAPLAEGSAVLVQTSAHGEPLPARLRAGGVELDVPARRVAPGQLVACYVGDRVVGSGIAT